MQAAAAWRMASLVTVAPETASTSALWADRIASCICSPISAPMPFVSPETSISTSVMLLASKVIVTLTSLPMPLAVALYVPGL